jgi:hypothetical protein
MGDFTIDPDALEVFAGTSLRRETALRDLGSEVIEVDLDANAFGHIPYLSEHLRTAYTEHVTACHDALDSAADAMHSIWDAVRDTVRQATGTDEDNDRLLRGTG